MEWTNERILEFIVNLEAEPIIWDPKETLHKKKDAIHDAWIRLKSNLSFEMSVQELKKKKESLMAYYRIHINKIKKSMKSGAGSDEVYKTSWFAFDALDGFLRPVYECEITQHTKVSTIYIFI